MCHEKKWEQPNEASILVPSPVHASLHTLLTRCAFNIWRGVFYTQTVKMQLRWLLMSLLAFSCRIVIPKKMFSGLYWRGTRVCDL